MHPNVLLFSLLLATSAVARPDLLRRNSCFAGPHGVGSYCDSTSPNGKAADTAASASAQSAAAISASAVSAVSAAAASAQQALGQSQLSVASAIEAAKASVQVQEKLAMTTGSLENPTSTFSIMTATGYGFAFAQAARYGHG